MLKNSKKHTLSFLLVLLTSLLFITSASAADSSTVNINPGESEKSSASSDFDNQLNKISDEYNIELVNLESNSSLITPTSLKFDTIEDFELFLKENEKNESVTTSEDVFVKPNNDRISLLATTYDTYYETTWWSPINGYVSGLLSWKNMSFDYKWEVVSNKPRFVSVSNAYSWQTGYHDVKWTHRNATYTRSTTNSYYDTVKVTTNGIYTLGVVIGSQPIGYTWNGAWERSLVIHLA